MLARNADHIVVSGDCFESDIYTIFFETRAGCSPKARTFFLSIRIALRRNSTGEANVE